MAYTNLLGNNPVVMSNDIEIRSGISSSGEEVADEYVVLGYEPELGSMYLATSGEVFIHYKAGIVANTWAKITAVGEPDVEQFNLGMALTAALQPVVIGDKHEATVTLASSIKQAISKKATATINLGASVLYWVSNWDVSVGLTLAGKALKSLSTAAKGVTTTLSAFKLINPIRRATITLAGAMTKVLVLSKTHSSSLSLAPTVGIVVTEAPSGLGFSLAAKATITVNP